MFAVTGGWVNVVGENGGFGRDGEMERKRDAETQRLRDGEIDGLSEPESVTPVR